MSNKPTNDLLLTCKLLNLKREKGLIISFKGHEIDLSLRTGDKIPHVLSCIANQLADRLTEIHNKSIEALFKEK